jgi:signal transduction histidine kinase
MSLKSRLRISIVALVTIVVISLSALYLYDFTSLAFQAVTDRADLVANQVKGYLLDRIDQVTAERGAHPANLAESKALWTDIVRTDPAIRSMLGRTLANADVVVNIHVSGENGETLVASNPFVGGRPAPIKADFNTIRHRDAFRNLFDLMTSKEDYITTMPLGVPQQRKPIFNITVVIRSSLLSHALTPAFVNLEIAFLSSFLVAVALAVALPSLVLNPLQRVSERIDAIRAGDAEPPPLPRGRESREFADVQSKLHLLGQQFRGAKQDAVELRSNIEDLLQRLEEAVLLFDPSGRLMMAGRPAERLLGKPREALLGSRIEDLFPPDTVLGSLIITASHGEHGVHDELVNVHRNGAGTGRLLVNVEILRRGENQHAVGTLVTLRDADTRRQLGLQLDVSSRLAAISRLTGGVAHEIKNPLNAIALHLEVLKGKLDAGDPEIDVISKEIKRLDHVVKTFLSFNRPIELNTQPIDLTELGREVIRLIAPEARLQSVQIEPHLDDSAWINGDLDLLKQAILNVVMNGVEAMTDGGRLSIRAGVVGEESVLTIDDNGPGIPQNIQDKIFNLYFTTKKSGSGIGLATAFRIIQLHGGTIEFSSELGKGTSFRLRFPVMSELVPERSSSVHAQA